MGWVLAPTAVHEKLVIDAESAMLSHTPPLGAKPSLDAAVAAGVAYVPGTGFCAGGLRPYPRSCRWR
ncbi:hypothetical protein [Streptomyces sp. NPDC005573]|uniref:hypothetical protein n=1 Tax=Streptomyces sp. NPDC005573 TaxID=3156890 RepID=UPI0033B0B271